MRSVWLSTIFLAANCGGSFAAPPGEVLKSAGPIDSPAASRSYQAEAKTNLRKLYEASAAYWEAEHASPTGETLPKQFPASAPLTPPTDCCRHPGAACEPGAATFTFSTWRALDFSIAKPFHYEYEYVSSGVGTRATVTMRAVGDPTCKGALEIWELRCRANEQLDMQCDPLTQVR